MIDLFLADTLGVLSCPFWSTILLQNLATEPRSTAGPPLFSSQCPCMWNDIADLVFDGVELVSFKSCADDFLMA